MGNILAAIRSLYCSDDVLSHCLPLLFLNIWAEYWKILQEAAVVFFKEKKLKPETVVEGRARADSEEMEGLPEVPRATLTRMRTFIAGESTVSSHIGDELEDGEGSWNGRR